MNVSNVPDTCGIRQATLDLLLRVCDATTTSTVQAMEVLQPYVELAQVAQALRIQQIAFFTNPKGSPERNAALNASKRLEKRIDALLGALSLPPIEDSQEKMPL